MQEQEKVSNASSMSAMDSLNVDEMVSINGNNLSSPSVVEIAAGSGNRNDNGPVVGAISVRVDNQDASLINPSNEPLQDFTSINDPTIRLIKSLEQKNANEPADAPPQMSRATQAGSRMFANSTTEGRAYSRSSIREQIRAVLGRINQRNSYIFELPNTDGLRDNIWLQILDTHKHSCLVLFVRASLIVLILTVATVITFAPLYIPSGHMTIPWGILTGIVLSSTFMFAFVVGTRYLFFPKDQIIGFDMVKWFSFLAFIDIIYYTLNPYVHEDVRKTIYEKNPPQIHEETVTKKKQKALDVDPTYVDDLEKISAENEHPIGSYFFDFLADTGDGFDPTYSVFSSIAKSEITVHNPRNNEDVIVLPRADSVFVGGDIAYPFPKHEVVMGRFIRPISWAFPTETQGDPIPGNEADLDESDIGKLAISIRGGPRMYIMPGNHEYYDGLENFTKLIINRDNIGRWKTPAKSPYFAVKLPYKWWVFCLDPGSDASQDLDPAQIAYFTNILNEQTTDEDKIILMYHEPDWIKNSGHKYKQYKELQRFRHEVLGKRVRLILSGDLHYYKRMEEVDIGNTTEYEQPIHETKKVKYDPNLGRKYVTDKRQIIVAGNGGAFSHPTCNPLIKEVTLGEPFIEPENQKKFKVACDYPTPEQCQKLMDEKWTKMFAFKKNFGYGHVVGAMYMLMFAAVSPVSLIHYSSELPTTWPQPYDVLISTSYLLQTVASVFFVPPLAWLIVEHIIVATTSHSLYDARSKCIAYSTAFIHTLAHLVFAFGMRKLIDTLFVYLFSLHPATYIQGMGTTIAFCTVTNLSMYFVGFFQGVWITQIYLYLVFTYIGDGHCYNEAYSPLTERNYKGFIRIRVDPDGDLILYTVGIEKTPRKWRQTQPLERSEKYPGFFVPKDGEKLKLILIEKIHLKRDYQPN